LGKRTEARIRLGWSTDRPIAVFIGALGDRRKGFSTVFEAWKILCASSDWDANLIVIGAGVELPIWEKRARDAGLSQRIQFLGFRRDVSDLLPACDVLVSPTRYEAYGLGVHEAICCGVASLVSRTAGVAERYTNDLDGLLLDDPDDATTLANRLREWRSREQFFRKSTETLGTSLRKRTWDVMAREITEVAGIK